MTEYQHTPIQTVGPFFHHSLLRADAVRNVVTSPNTAGRHIRIEGRVLDGDGVPVLDGMVEIWQADGRGHYCAAPSIAALAAGSFLGFGRSGTDDDGRFWFETIKPGPVPMESGGLQAPHINVAVFARGLRNHLYTRLYFADDPANVDDPVLQRVPAERQATLLAKPETSPDGAVLHRFDIILQGANETVFFQT